MDGIGGETKRKVAMKVMRGKVDVSTSIQFTEVASRVGGKTVILHCSPEEVNTMSLYLNTLWETIEGIPNTLRIHKVMIVAPNTIDVQTHAKSATTKHHFFIKDPTGQTILANE